MEPLIETANAEARAAALEEQRAAEARAAARSAVALGAGVNALPTPPVAPSTHHPAAVYWGVDSLFDAHVELVARQLAALPEATAAGDVLWLGNHPIRHVSICGLVVSMHPKHPVVGHESRLSFVIDDTTGVVECVRG